MSARPRADGRRAGRPTKLASALLALLALAAAGPVTAADPPADPAPEAATGNAETAAGAVTGEPVAGAGAVPAVIRRTADHGTIVIDGTVGEEEWEAATAIAVPWEWFPVDNAPSPVETEVLVTFDDERLYVAFRARDPEPGAIRAHLSDRDAALRDDVVGFEIDTFADRRRAYRFQVNPLGVQLDAQINDVDGTVDLSWNAIWDSAGRLTPGGYEVELAIPFKQLRFPRQAGVQSWGFLAYRDYPRSVLHELKSLPNDRDLDCRVCKYGTIEGLAGLDTGHNLEATPTLTGKRTDRRRPGGGGLESGDEEVDAGASVRWGITPNVALSAAVNPDFSQVEADAAQLDVNERFALFFPERRPFFLEGADFFATPFQALFTRTVADPEAGLKLTGKEGAHAFGVFVARDRLNNLLFPGPEASSFASLDQAVTSGAVRYRRDVGRTSTLGFLYTGRDAPGYGNHLYGFDGSLRLGASDTLRFQLLESRTEYPAALARERGQPEGDFDGIAYRLDYTRTTGDWLFRLFHSRLDDGFRADSGFIPRVGYRQSFGIVQRNFWGRPDGWYSRLALIGNAIRLEDLDGGLIEQGANFELLYEGPLQSSVRLGIRPNEESFRGVTFENLRGDLTATLRPSGDLTLELFLRGGEVIDFTNVRQADFVVVRPRVAFKVGRHFTGDLQHEWQQFEVPRGRFLTANLSQGTMIYHLNVRTFFRAILQYRDVERRLALFNPGVTLPAEDEQFFSQLLFSYKLNAQTVLLAGYSDLHQGGAEVDLTQTDRTFFLKLGYAFLW